jgi:SAM-dependent methyltransferase
VNPREAADFLAKAVPRTPGVWADLGAGTGMFTRALAHILGPGSTIYAVDRDKHALAKLERAGTIEGVKLVALVGDLTSALELPGALDGILLANALHYVGEPARVLKQLVKWLRPGGSVVLIEYDRRRANRWVPYPIDSARLPEIAAEAGLSAPVISGTMPSRFAGTMYIARFS